MFDEIVRRLEASSDLLRQRAREGELLIIDDIFAGMPLIETELTIFCLDGRIDNDGNLSSVSPGLSFQWSRDGVDQFASAERLRRSVTEFRQKFDTEVELATVDDVTYLHAPRGNDIKKLVLALARAVAIVASNSLNALNKQQDTADDLARELMLGVGQAGGRFGLLELANFLDRKTNLDFGLLHLADAPSTPLGRTITVSAASSSPDILSELSRFLHLPTDTFASPQSKRPAPFQAIPLPTNRIAELIVNAGQWGKPLISGSSVESGRRLLIVPIARPLAPRGGVDEQPPLTAADLLFTFLERLDRRLMDQLTTCVNTFSADRYGPRRFNLLTKLRGGEIVKPRIPLDHFANQATAQMRLTNALPSLLDELLYITSAHSVSVRVYDPQSRSLKSVAHASGIIDGIPQEQALPDIPVRNNSHSSVVAFTFLNAFEGLPFTYLRRISPPHERIVHGKMKMDHRTFIPKHYKALGLQAPLRRREMTRSEICFPLIKGQLAFGTINLEAPYPAAFDRDIDFLTLVKNGIEQLYGVIDEMIDGQWLITNAARSDSIHQLWQYQDEGSFFTAEQNKLLRTIFPPRSEHPLTGVKNLSALRTRLISWVKSRYQGELQEVVIKMIKFDHMDERVVDVYFFETAFVIIRNLVQNAVKHGEPGSDLLFIDDRPWFGARRIPCLRIHYRTNEYVAPEVIGILGLTPVQQADGGRVAYGMYNVGLLTRLIGGSLLVADGDGSARFTIEVHLPLERFQI